MELFILKCNLEKIVDKHYILGFETWYQCSVHIFKNGKFHRTNGPAITWPDGKKSYYINGLRVEKQEYYEFYDFQGTLRKN